MIQTENLAIESTQFIENLVLPGEISLALLTFTLAYNPKLLKLIAEL